MASAEGLSASCSNGVFEGVLSGDIISWKGIPYAKAPVDSLRWKAPEAPDNSTETFRADKFTAIPIQYVSASNPEYYMPQDEDCLYLNIWKASGDESALKPVMVWIHGGAFKDGAAASPYYDGQSFVENNPEVIYITVDYRLGLMGFIDFVNSGLAGAEDFKDSGNLGNLDILQSLKWLKENIASFGGDPDNITLFGQSSGSACISLLMSMEESAGLFRRAITESGAVSMTSSVTEAAELTQKLIELTGASSMSDLMALSSQDLYNATRDLNAYLIFPERGDGIIAEYPSIAFAQNSVNFDLLTGSNANEVNYWSAALGGLEQFSMFVQIAYSQIVNGISLISEDDAAKAQSFVELRSGDLGVVMAKAEFLNDLLFRGPAITQAEAHSSYASQTGKNTKTYMYYWKYPSPTGLGACHAAEIGYVLNSHNYPLAIPLNQDLADKVQAMWVNFASNGDPSINSSVSWPEYDAASRRTLIINQDGECSTEDAPLDAQREYIEPLLIYGISGRDLISAVASQPDDQPQDNVDSDDIKQNPDSDDITKEPDSDDIKQDTDSDDVKASGPGSSGGGCETGALFVPVIIYFAIKKRRA